MMHCVLDILRSFTESDLETVHPLVQRGRGLRYVRNELHLLLLMQLDSWYWSTWHPSQQEQTCVTLQPKLLALRNEAD